MKKISWVPVGVVTVLCASVICAQAEVQIGDTADSVVETLGPPSGFVEVNGAEALTFDRGRVFFRDGRVVSHALVSSEEAERRRETATRQGEERTQQGQELRDRQLEDEAFAERPARERLAYWTAFRQRYPEVDIGIAHAVAAQEVEMEERERMRELEMEVMREERLAEAAAKHAPDPAKTYPGSGWPLLFSDPFFHHGFQAKHFQHTDRRHLSPAAARMQLHDAPSIRQRAMPMQTIQHTPGLRHGHSQPSHYHRGHGRQHSR